MSAYSLVEGDLLAQAVDAIVNPWNRNFIPWWLLVPQGVAGAIRRHAGTAPFREVARHGLMPLGAAVVTGAGRLPFKGIIHVAGIGFTWRASAKSVGLATANALKLAEQQDYASVAMPLIGAGTGGLNEDAVLAVMRNETDRAPFRGRVLLVRYRRPAAGAESRLG